MAGLVAAWIALYATADNAPPGDFWQWFATNVSVEGVLNTAGLGLLAILFARDLILTKAQHERRVADIVKAQDLRVADMEKSHAAEIAAKDERYNDMLREKSDRYGEMKESRDTYRSGGEELQNRNRELTDAVVDSNKAMAVAATALQSLDRVVRERGS